MHLPATLLAGNRCSVRARSSSPPGLIDCHHPGLRVEWLFTLCRSAKRPGTILAQDAGVDGVAKIGADEFVMNVAADRRILDWEYRLDPAVQIPLHQISATEKEFLVAAVAEIVDPAMLQEPSDNADDADVLTPIFHARSKAAYSANDEIDLDTGLRCAVERSDCFPVDK